MDGTGDMTPAGFSLSPTQVVRGELVVGPEV